MVAGNAPQETGIRKPRCVNHLWCPAGTNVDDPSIQVRSQRTAHRLGHRLDLVAVTVMVDADTQ